MIRIFFALLTIIAVAGCGSSTPTDDSQSIAAQIGPNATCSQSTYALIDKSSGKKTAIYDCANEGKAMCVTESNGVVENQTAIVRLLFSTSLSGKPDCLGG